MIHFDPAPEPEDFDRRVRQKGQRWLEGQPNGPPRAFWAGCKSDLASGFRNLCAYSAMYEAVGTVDHYLSWRHHRQLAYEWSNYRYASAWINSSKGGLDDQVLDPFEVGNDWFRLLLPSLQLVLNEAAIPAAQLERARFTLEKLHLRDDERVIRQRREWLRLYEAGELSLEGLRSKAPLIAQAVERQQQD